MKMIFYLIAALLMVSAECSQTAEEFYNRGNAKVGLQRYRWAIEDYTKALELDPEYAMAYYNRGAAKYGIQDYKGAITDYTRAIELDPEYAMAYYNRGLAKGKLQDYLGAISDYTRAIEIDPEAAEAYLNRGLTKIGLGLKNSGCLDLSKAGELGLAVAYEVIKEHCQ